MLKILQETPNLALREAMVTGLEVKEFKSKKEKSYAIEFSKDLRAWEEIKTINGTGEMIRFEDERDQVFPQIYYRVKVAN